ncbi:MAG: hypothetical protein P4N60_09550 [Verrucomicrobiae bacterium]|nr:hypothetical protein [Verrucomicrobiae bacterium]
MSITASILAVGSAQAFEFQPFGTNLPPVDLHGFASQGYIYNSGHNNYLGGYSSDGSPDFREYGINASVAYNKWRVGAQFFGQKLGPYGDDQIKLDWGNVDYQATQWFGVRAGRVKTPRGLYNETLDLDSTRTFALLPQSVYDARLRDFNSSFDGGMIYGNIEMKKLGSLDYRAYVGSISLSPLSGASDYFNNDIPYPNTKIGMDATYGGSLFWNTPVQGLKVGYSVQMFNNFNALRTVSPTSSLWRGTSLYLRQTISAEYTRDKWVFAAEAGRDSANYWVQGFGNDFQNYDSYYGYVSATRQITDKFSLGTYFSYSDQMEKCPPYAPFNTDDRQGDLALAGCYNFTSYLLAKLEIHYMNGSGMLFNTPTGATANQPRNTRDNSWAMIVAKVTLSF